MEDSLLQKSYVSNISPQINKNKKIVQISRLSQRLSLMKRHLKIQRHQTSLDIMKLRQINQKGKQFQKKVIDQINQCKQLQLLKDGSKQQENPSDIRKQIKNWNFNEQKKLYNLTDIIKKDNQNLKTQTSQQKCALNQFCKQQVISKRIQSSNKKSKKKNLYANKNLFFFQPTKINFLKETILISIIFIIIGIIYKYYKNGF